MQNNLICVLNPVVIIHVLLLICSFNWNRSAKNDGRSNVDDQSEFKVLSNCCYPNCGQFVESGNFPLIETFRYYAYYDSYIFAYFFLKSFTIAVLCFCWPYTFYYWITVLVFCVFFFAHILLILITCVFVYFYLPKIT